MEDESLFLTSLPVIDDVARQVCRRHRLSGAEAEDFRSEVRLHFLQHDCKVLRSFQGRSSLPTFVNVVVQRLYLDYRNRQWGRWRPSADARRRGPMAVLFEQLVVRDGWSCDEATELLRVNHQVDPREIASIARCVVRKPARQIVGEHEAGGLESPEPRPDASMAHAEQEGTARRVHMTVDRARRALSPQDAMILKMRFDETMPVAAIARALHLEQKRLYRTIDRILRRLRRAVEAEGLAPGQTRTVRVLS